MIPKHALLYDAPDHVWGIARLRNPVVLLQLRTLPDSNHAEVILWPPDVEALASEKKMPKILDALWGYLDCADADDHDSYGPEQVDLAQALPRWLFVDDESADFSALLDTGKAVLWEIAEDYRSLSAVLDWQMHPKLPPQIEFPASTREIAAVWEAWREAEQRLEEGEDE